MSTPTLIDGFETVVGLEVHVQLKTARKLFSPAAVGYGQAPNTDLDAVDAGLPGALPVLNPEAVRFAVRLGLATGGDIAAESFFARKHYFYPDSPKGFQTSQSDRPILSGGVVRFVRDDKADELVEGEVILERAHLEEDAGKSLHGDGETRIDLNRAGTPLLEVVTTPCMRSGDEAMRFFRALRAIAMAVDICDGNLQEGSMRADANVSVRRPGEPLGTRVELKNINSPRFLQDAVEHEAARQRRLLHSGGVVSQETRLWDGEARQSRVMRTKEDAPDYRYLTDPDLPALRVDEALIAAERATLPELPADKRRRYLDVDGLSLAQAIVLVDEPALSRLYDDASATTPPAARKALANWLLNELAAIDGATDALPPAVLARLVVLIDGGDVSGRDGKTLLRQLAERALRGDTLQAGDVDAAVDAQGLRVQKGKDAEAAVQAVIDQVFAQNPTQVEQVKSGKDKVKGFLVGQCLKTLGKGVDPKLVQRLVDETLAR